MFSISPLLLLSLSFLVLSHFLHLPSLLLHSLHTYIHPDHLPSALRPPNTNPKSHPSQFDDISESQAQLLRLRLSHHLLLSRPSFLVFHTSILLLLSSLPIFFFINSNPLPLLSLFPLLFSILLTNNKYNNSSTTSFPKLLLLLLLMILALIFSLFLLPKSPLSLLAPLLYPIFFPPSSLLARSFWLATDQPRSNLSIISAPSHHRLLLYLSALATALSPLIFLLHHKSLPLLLAAPILQLLTLRPNLQMYLNEAVFCWYQRLHSARKPDLEYARAKVFLHNHYVCAAATQLAAPPAMVVILLGVAGMRGNLFTGLLFLDDDWSDGVKEGALLLACWIVLLQGIVMTASLALYRLGFMFVS